MTFTKPSTEYDALDENYFPVEKPLLSEVESSKEIATISANLHVETAQRFHGVGVTVVFPCLNEELAVGSCVALALETMRAAGIDGAVIVVDNGSTDNSANVALEAGAQVIVQREPGYGAALRSGIEAAKTEFVIMADADGTYELDAIPRLLIPLIDGEADMVLGQRLSDATTATMPWLHRYVGTPAITYLVKKATKNEMTIRDSQSGFRAFRRDQIMELNLSSTGMEFASEMLIRSSWAKLRIREVDTKYAERIGESKLSTFSDGLRHLRQILLLSPETGASIPGIVATASAVLLWIFAAASTRTFGQVGSLGWVADVVAGVLSILGPLVFCTGIVLRYRAESSGLRSAHVKLPLDALIRRFMVWGGVLLTLSIVSLVVLLFNFHNHPPFISASVAASFSSFVRSAFVVGVVLLVAPLIAPFLTSSPRSQLPVAEAERDHSVLIFGESHDRIDVAGAMPAMAASQRFERGATTRRRFAAKFPNTAKRSA
jgi:glycosyltransferase involved in cell wall biosynthesis